jgi:nicotinamide-nucleotide amidase
MAVVDEELLNKISSLLKKQNLTIATAESCTGGFLANYLTNISGSSEYFDRGIVSYSNESKIQLLDVPKELLIKYGAVSEQVAEIMAKKVRSKSDVDIGIATTGIAGPTGGTPEKPVGLVFIAITTKEKTKIKRFQFSGSRLEIKEKTCKAALETLHEIIR